MKPNQDDGLPELGNTGSCLGVRPKIGVEGDIPVDNGKVRPNTGGMSVVASDPMRLPGHRRPPAFSGSQRNLKVFFIEEDVIPAALQVRADNPVGNPYHRCVEPAAETSFDEYVVNISSTRPNWSAIDEPDATAK